MRNTVLLVDDEPKVLSGLTRVLQNEPYEIVKSGNAEEAAEVLRTTPVDLMICDEQMPGMPGAEFLAQVARDYPNVIRIVLTGQPTLPAALLAINDGKVYHIFTKPCNEIDLVITIRRALEQRDLTMKSRDLLEVAKRQSVLIDEARVLRRLQDLPHRDRAEAIAKGEQAMDYRELLDEIDREVDKGRTLLANIKNERGL